MKIIFIGTSDFAVTALKKLTASHHQVKAVLTQPDRPQGRGLKSAAPPVKNAASEAGLPVYQPGSGNEILQTLKGLRADLLVVISYGYILKTEVLELAPLGAINLHFSYLPAYRGAAPVNWALINGEPKTGVSVIKLDKFVDHGGIIIQEQVEILDNDNVLTLSDKLAHQGADILLKAIDLLSKGQVELMVQDESKAGFAPKLKKEDGRIDWSLPADSIRNRIRGLMPWPGCFTCYKGKILKLFKAELQADDLRLPVPGTVALDKKKGIIVQTGKGSLLITGLQLQGRKKVSGIDFIAGRQIKAGDVLSG